MLETADAAVGLERQSLLYITYIIGNSGLAAADVNAWSKLHAVYGFATYGPRTSPQPQ